MFVYTIQPVVILVVKPGCTTGWMFVYTIQPVVNPVGFDNRLDNRLYRVNGVLQAFSIFFVQSCSS